MITTTTPSTTTAAERLQELDLVLPKAPPAAAQYLPWTRHESLLFVAGQLPFVDGELAATGLVGRDLDVDQANQLARLCALNALAVAHDALGSLDDGLCLRQLVVFVASDPSFASQHLVADGASTLMVDVLGDRGRHARTAVATPILPLNSPVEIQATFGLDPARQLDERNVNHG
ncbi:RidA family protein [Nocardioides sp. WS12]|uniref:RidA family protein n=1 Tax=Nocardioides sp. WS12 TaxID=2486272 RepID=UPI0015FC1E32|nr:RidA family protein [Nocardioides sp. WS12]